MKNLPVPANVGAHYRLVLRPERYEQERVRSLRDLWKLVEDNRVQLRGWDFPHVDNQREQGANWIASSSQFMGYIEYWRFFQSAQFLYLGSVREMRPSWDAKLRNDFMPPQNTTDRIPGFISITNFVYTVTEYFEFANRLCQKGLYDGTVSVTLEMHGIKGFALTVDNPRRHWWRLCQASDDYLGKTWQINSAEMVSNSNEHALEVMTWFFERFGWLEVNKEALKADQDDLLNSRF